MNPSVCLLVGDNHTLHCGVKDYARRLGQALEEIGLSVEVLAPPDWSARSLLPFASHLRKRAFDIVHLQYPSIGHRASFGPHLIGCLGVARRSVVTVHEHSALPWPQRASMQLFRWSADRLLFTSEAERASFGGEKDNSEVLYIGSNLPAHPAELPRLPDVLYFGQIRPNKGLESFLALARRAAELERPFRFAVIGSVPPRRQAYFEAIRASAPDAIEWQIDLPGEAIAERLAGSLAAYLPYPDGASYRRGSLLASIANGLPVITRAGSITPTDLASVVLLADDPECALAHLDRLLASPAQAEALGDAGRRFAKRFDWGEIARHHKRIYLEALASAPQTAPRNEASSLLP